MMTSWEYIYYGNKMTSEATMRIYPPQKKKERKKRKRIDEYTDDK